MQWVRGCGVVDRTRAAHSHHWFQSIAAAKTEDKGSSAQSGHGQKAFLPKPPPIPSRPLAPPAPSRSVRAPVALPLDAPSRPLALPRAPSRSLALPCAPLAPPSRSLRVPSRPLALGQNLCNSYETAVRRLFHVVCGDPCRQPRPCSRRQPPPAAATGISCNLNRGLLLVYWSAVRSRVSGDSVKTQYDTPARS